MEHTADTSEPQRLTITYFKRANTPTGTRCPLTWPELVAWCQRPDVRAPSKDALPLIKLATFTGDYRSDANLEAIYGIEGDYDGGTVQPAIAAAWLAEAGICALVITTPSHRADAPRFRVFCPTSRPLQPAEHHGLVSRLQGALRGILAPESFVASQAYYAGAVDGWSYLARSAPLARAAAAFGSGTSAPVFGEMLTPDEQRAYFEGCALIGPRNVIVDRKGIEYGPGAFNAAKGGKRFIISSDGKTTDEPWKAATRSTVWTVPKVDGYAFRTDLPTGDVATDELGRTAVNVYVPARIDRMEGDPAPFLDHLALVIPDEADRRVLLDYLAHNVRFPGFKIPWAPLIQSAEGVGKNALKHVMNHAIGNHYTYAPNAKELGSSGSKFNAWMERKLFLIADEIKTDDRRDLIEILKPMITEEALEIQGKGVDQRKAENPANWLFFSNHKDAIPIGKNDRRFAIFYSAIQSKADLDSAGMDGAYFARLYDEFLGNRSHRRGLKIMADYLLRYPIERGAVPMRAPITTSTLEAVEVGRGWLEQLIAEAVDNEANGFRAGWINTAAVGRVLRENGRKAGPHPIGNAIAALGFHRIGQAGRGWWNDEPQDVSKRGYLYHREPSADPADYGRAQGYE